MRLLHLSIILVLLTILPMRAHGGIMLLGDLKQAEGVKWAADELSEAAKENGVRVPNIMAEISTDDLGVDDGYVLHVLGPRGLMFSANSEGGVIHGLLDLRDRIRLGDPIPDKLKFVPTLRFRATDESFPFWVGTTMYSNHWKVFEKQETDPKSWWRDKAAWTRRFREAAEERVNAFVFNHPHPYPALLVYDKYPEAQVYSREWAERNAEMFKWIVHEGRKYGVSIYFLTWNIVVPPSFAKAHDVPEFGSKSQIAKDYTRYCVKKLFDTYPELGGLITMGAETPVGCTDWVIDNVVSAMNECNPKPNLIWWGWCTYPEDSLKVKKAYKGRTEILHYLQYEQYFKPMADPRIGRWSRETGGTKMIALGGPKSAHAFYTWGDPNWARETIRSLKEDNNGSGLILETWMSGTWLARQAFCRYMWNLGTEDEPAEDEAPGIGAEWERRIGEHYSPDAAPGFLKCYKAASKIIPRFVCLIHSQTDHYQPQLGLPLVYYLGMPSLSTYVFEWYNGVDRHGRLTPNYGLTWPNPDWGENVLTIPWYAYWTSRGRTSFTSTTPPAIADEIESSAFQVLKILPQLEKVSPADNKAEYSHTLKLLRMNAYWGMQAAWKIRAAVAWAEFKELGKLGHDIDDTADRCVKDLEESLEWYRKLADLASQIYPNRMQFYQSLLSSPPPWKQNDIWFSYQPVNTHWRDMLPRYEKELEIVKEQVKLGPEHAVLPLLDELWREPEERVIASYDFEKKDSDLRTDTDAAYTSKSADVISGHQSLVLDTRNSSGEWHMSLKTRPDRLKLQPGLKYQVRLRYKVLYNPNRFQQPFAMGARSDKGGSAKDIGTFRTWTAPAGMSGEHVIQIEPKDYDDYYVFLLVRGPAVLVVDDLTIAEVSTEEDK